MSELTKFVKKIDQLSSQWNSLNKDVENDVPSSVLHGLITAIIQQHEKMLLEINEDLHPTGEKLSAKLNQIDPVTGERRYGQQSMQKFNVAFELLMKISEEINSNCESLKKKYEEILMQVVVAESTVSTNSIADAVAEQKRREEEEKLRREREEAMEAVRKRAEEEAVLHEQAEKIRKRKHQEYEMCKAVEQRIITALQATANYLNVTLPQERNISKYLNIIKSHTVSSHRNNDPNIRQVLKTLLDIMDRIIASPDDIKARSLRINHPVLKTKLTGVPGCLQVLALLGFHAVIRDTSIATNDPNTTATTSSATSAVSGANSNAVSEETGLSYVTASNKTHYDNLLDRLDTALGHGEDMTCLFELLHPATQWEYYMEMEEPAIDAVDPHNPSQNMWIAWYDQLKASQSILQKTLEENR